MRGSIVKRQGKATKDGKPITLYYVVYQVGKRQKWEAVPERTRKAAEKLLAKRLNEIGNGEYREPSRMTFGEFKDVWVEKYAEGQVRGTSLDKYQSMFRAHILPAFGQMELAGIGVEDVQGFKSRLLADGLSPKTVEDGLCLVRQVLDHAVDWGYLRHNPASKVKAPKVPKPEMDCLAPEEARVFLDNAPPRWYAFFLTAITTGLRIGELSAMKWGNLDWNQGRYFVKENLTRRGEFAKPKTESSLAPVDVTPRCLEALREHRARQAEERLKAGESYQDHDLIFATSKGTTLNDRNVTERVFHPALKAAGLRRIRFHDLRHTCASLLINQGESPKYVQKQMRHASIQMTFDRYGHLFPEANREAVRRLDEALFNSADKASAGSAI
jgi:integrase